MKFTNKRIVATHFSARGLCLLVIAMAAVAGCSDKGDPSPAPAPAPAVQKKNDVEVGGLYTSKGPEGTWRITKVLVVDEHAVHVRMYANQFAEQPKDVDPATLHLGKITDPGGFGIGHAPMSKKGFIADKQVLVKIVPVNEEELDGYREYLEAMKGR